MGMLSAGLDLRSDRRVRCLLHGRLTENFSRYDSFSDHQL